MLSKTNSFAIAVSSVLISACGGGSGADGAVRTVNINATVTWTAPTSNADGTSLVDLAGYHLYYRHSDDVYSVPVRVGNTTSYTVSAAGVPAGTYYFAVTAYDSDGNESDYSEEASKIFQ